jgi:hypothetical protein
MRVYDLIKAFENHDTFPIKVEDVARLLMESGIEEEISYIGVELDIGILRGFIVQTTEPRGVYSSDGNGGISKIYYGFNQDFEWQRLVCCKETLHILDASWQKVATPDEVSGLVKKMALPPQFQIVDGTEDEKKALFDRVGALQAVAILFPLAIRELLLPKYQEGVLTDDEIVRIVCLPQVYVRLVMSEFWPDIWEELRKL